jgi:hypothetical protein
LEAFNISSTHMKATIALRRIKNPAAPMVNKTADSTT